MTKGSPPPDGGTLERLLIEAARDPFLADRLQRDPLKTAEEHGVVTLGIRDDCDPDHH